MSSFHRTWPIMKIKLLSLLLILAGIIMISGCVDEEAHVFTDAHAFTNEAPFLRLNPQANLFRIILYPYIGLLNHGEPEMTGVHPPALLPGFHPVPGSMHNLKGATSLLDRNIEKAETISVRLENGIENYKAEGEDVSRLEVLLEEYNLLIEEAKHYRALADSAAGNNSSIANSDLYNNSSKNLEREYLIQSQGCMIQANYILRDIFEELSHMAVRSEELNSTSKLVSVGNGKVLLMGSFTLNMHLEDGEMAILGLSTDSEIDINGDYTFEEKNEDHENVRLYHINSADVKVSGSSKTVMLRDENITLTADGEGYAAFQGNGTYRVEEAGRTVKEEKWGKPLFDDRMNSGECGPNGKGNDVRGCGPDGKDDNTEYRHEGRI